MLLSRFSLPDGESNSENRVETILHREEQPSFFRSLPPDDQVSGTLWCGLSNGSLQAYQVRRNRLQTERRRHKSGISCMVDVNNKLWTGSKDGSLCVSDFKIGASKKYVAELGKITCITPITPKLVQPPENTDEPPPPVVYERVLVGTASGQITIHCASSPQTILINTSVEARNIHSVVSFAHSAWVAADGCIFILSPTTFKAHFSLGTPREDVQDAFLSPPQEKPSVPVPRRKRDKRASTWSGQEPPSFLTGLRAQAASQKQLLLHAPSHEEEGSLIATPDDVSDAMSAELDLIASSLRVGQRSPTLSTTQYSASSSLCHSPVPMAGHTMSSNNNNSNHHSSPSTLSVQLSQRLLQLQQQALANPGKSLLQSPDASPVHSIPSTPSRKPVLSARSTRHNSYAEGSMADLRSGVCTPQLSVSAHSPIYSSTPSFSFNTACRTSDASIAEALEHVLADNDGAHPSLARRSRSSTRHASTTAAQRTPSEASDAYSHAGSVLDYCDPRDISVSISLPFHAPGDATRKRKPHTRHILVTAGDSHKRAAPETKARSQSMRSSTSSSTFHSSEDTAVGSYQPRESRSDSGAVAAAAVSIIGDYTALCTGAAEQVWASHDTHGVVHVWDSLSPELICEIYVCDEGIKSIRHINDSMWMWSTTGTIYCIDSESYSPRREIHVQSVSSVACTATSRRHNLIFSCSMHRNVCAWVAYGKGRERLVGSSSLPANFSRLGTDGDRASNSSWKSSPPPSPPHLRQDHAVATAYDPYGFQYDEEDLEEDCQELAKALEPIKLCAGDLNARHSHHLLLEWHDFFSMLGDNLDFFHYERSFQLLIQHSIPDMYRPAVWSYLINKWVEHIKEQVPADYYAQLSQRVSTGCVHQVELDLHRTFPTNKFYRGDNAVGIEKLRKVLCSYSFHNQEVMYCQGFNFITGFLLLFLKEEDAFWGLVAIVDNIMGPEYYVDPMLSPRAHQRLLTRLLAEMEPDLHDFFTSNYVDISLVTFQWFFTLFIECVSMDLTLAIWDSLLFEGAVALFRYSIAVLVYFKEDIMALTSRSQIMTFLKTIRTKDLIVSSVVEIAQHLEFDEQQILDDTELLEREIAIEDAHNQDTFQFRVMNAEEKERFIQQQEQQAGEFQDDLDESEALSPSFGSFGQEHPAFEYIGDDGSEVTALAQQPDNDIHIVTTSSHSISHSTEPETAATDTDTPLVAASTSTTSLANALPLTPFLPGSISVRDLRTLAISERYSGAIQQTFGDKPEDDVLFHDRSFLSPDPRSRSSQLKPSSPAKRTMVKSTSSTASSSSLVVRKPASTSSSGELPGHVEPLVLMNGKGATDHTDSGDAFVPLPLPKSSEQPPAVDDDTGAESDDLLDDSYQDDLGPTLIIDFGTHTSSSSTS